MYCNFEIAISLPRPLYEIVNVRKLSFTMFDINMNIFQNRGLKGSDATQKI